MKPVIDPALASDPNFLNAVLEKYFSDPCEAGFTYLIRLLHHLPSNQQALSRKIIDRYYGYINKHGNNPIFLNHFVQILLSFERHLEATYYAAYWTSLDPKSVSREYFAQCAAVRRDYCTLLNIANSYTEDEQDSYSFKLVAILYLITMGHCVKAVDFAFSILTHIRSPNPPVTCLLGIKAVLEVGLQTKDASLISLLLQTTKQLGIEFPLDRREQSLMKIIMAKTDTKEESHE